MLMTVDVGNTTTLFGLFSDNGPAPVATVRVSSRRDRMPDEWYAILEPGLRRQNTSIQAITAIVISSVVPEVTGWLRELGDRMPGVATVVVSSTTDLGIAIATDTPAGVGTDRVVNALAARERYGCPAIVIDFGTATNFDVVDHEGHYTGGALAPGVLVSLEAMAKQAARLFSVELEFPDHAIGRNTVDAMQSGLMYGYLSLVEGMIARLSDDLGSTPVVISTGGLGARFAEHSNLIAHHDPDLTLFGLKLAWDYLQGSW